MRPDSEEEEIGKAIQRNGWYAIAVGDARPVFSYTIGFGPTFSHPEAIIFGLDSREAYAVLRAMTAGLRSGKSYAEPGTYNGLHAERLIAVRRVNPSQHELYLGYAMGYYRHIGLPDELSAIQLFWADESGKLPFQAGFDAMLSDRQPRLDLPVPPSDLRRFRRKYGVEAQGAG